MKSSLHTKTEKKEKIWTWTTQVDMFETESQARPYTPNKIQAFRMTIQKWPQLINARVKEDIALRETNLN